MPATLRDEPRSGPNRLADAEEEEVVLADEQIVLSTVPKDDENDADVVVVPTTPEDSDKDVIIVSTEPNTKEGR
ncbi:MAG TPA: hypothetical protein VGF45_15020 [Polyangia bacterium]